MNMINPQAGFKVDVSRGEMKGRVSSEWFTRPDDQRFLSLNELYASVRQRAENAREQIIDTAAIRIQAEATNPDHMSFTFGRNDDPVTATHHSFGQLCQLVSAPAGYLRSLPAPLAAINLQHGLIDRRVGQMKTMTSGDSLRAVTGPDYGRIWDWELVEAIRRVTGDGTGDTRWKIPGVLDWNTMVYNPYVDPTRHSTTLYASDRDVFVFLVDDTNPIEAGRLPDGSPDLFFRGFYAWNSEVGCRTLGLATFYLRAVCMNRNLWGVENFKEIKIRHSKLAAHRFSRDLAPALARYAASDATRFVTTMQTARQTVVARDDDDRRAFLKKHDFTQTDADAIIQTVLREEGRPASSIFDFVQGITAVARDKPHQDARLALETKAGRLMAKL